ncbi:mechanosensitive ion channel family protein [Sphingopyxis sp.]|jgi:small conductance mechanosensitive channel|uniref:mechanosensitive ion channel family protein n=1 Tax=Sphingopyxis sp. TaxID=1908224 RepID=UPI002E07291B|nr:mechanosensitive ion channel domain-containing protein [Sphingopyxis sp.]
MDLEFRSEAIVTWIARIGSAALILIIGLWLAFFLSKLVRKKAIEHPRIDATLGTFLSMMIRYALIVLVLIIVLQQFGVQTTSLVAVLGASALAIGLALQGTLTNVASGIMIAIIRPYHLGDFVEVNGKEGTVIDLDLFFTRLRSSDEQIILVPNGQAASNPIINHTQKGRRRCIITVGIGYEDDIDKALSVMSELMMSDKRAIADPPGWFGVKDLGDSSVNIQGRAWVPTTEHRIYKSEMTKFIKEAFDREGIEIPYPHAVELSKGEVERREAPIKPSGLSR